jgi:hypothetical protein
MFRFTCRRAVCAVVAAATTAVVAGVNGPAPAGAEPGLRLGQEKLIGSWRLLSFEARTSDGRVLFPFGHDVRGVLTYTGDGRMSATVAKAARQPFAINDQQKGTPEEYTAAVQTYISYLGTFDVDRATHTVVHHVEQSIFPNWDGQDQVRYYAFSDHGDRLEITTPPTPFGGATVVAAVVWERIAN